MTQLKTSLTSPLKVDWLVLPDDVVAAGGRLGLTLAPGKHADSKYTEGRWERDLAVDLDRLRDVWKITDLVPLLPNDELVFLKIPNLVKEAEARGFTVTRFPIVDGHVPSLEACRALVIDLAERVRAGLTVVIHCQGGLGRAGTIGACTLIALGLDAEEALARVKDARGDNAPENATQKDFVRAFVIDDEEDEDGLAGEFDDEEDAVDEEDAEAEEDGEAEEEEGDVEEGVDDEEDVGLPFEVPFEPVAARALRDSMRGCVLGGAIGDALGHPTEFMSMSAIHQKFGPKGVQGFELYWNRGGLLFAPYTDDTQMAEQVLRTLLEAREAGVEEDVDAVMDIMTRRFIDWDEHPQGGHRAPGNACRAGCAALKKGVDWREAGGPQAGGCGSVMRAYPFGLFFHDDVDTAVALAVDHSRLTHNDPIALAACAAMALGVARQLQGKDVVDTALEMIAVARRYSEPTALMMARALGEAGAKDVSEAAVMQRLQSWAAHEAIAAGLYLMVRYRDDPQAAVVAGANTPGDSDSIATLAGALLGARHGVSAWPNAWINDVERAEELVALTDLIVDGGAPDDVEGDAGP